MIFELEQGLPFTFLYVTCAVFELKSLGAAAQTCHLILALCSEGCSTLAEEKVNSNGNVKKKKKVHYRTGELENQFFPTTLSFFVLSVFAKLLLSEEKSG